MTLRSRPIGVNKKASIEKLKKDARMPPFLPAPLNANEGAYDFFFHQIQMTQLHYGN